MISKPTTLQKLTIDKQPQNKISDEDSSDNEIFTNIDLENYILPSDISNFKDIPLQQFTILDLTGHLLTTFEGINRFPSLKKLIIKRTLVSSFKGSVEMPELEEIDFTETPLSRQSYCREMALFALGFQIQIINHFPVTQTEKNLSSLSSRKNIGNAIQKGNYIISYPNSNPISSFISQNLGFCSTQSSIEMSATFAEFNKRNAQKNPKEINATYDQIASELYANSSSFKRARTQYSNQSKWFKQQSIHYTSENDEIENLRLQINGLKPPLSYVKRIENFLSDQKIDQSYISSLKDQIEHHQKLSNEYKSGLRLSTEMNFNLQLKIKDAKSGKFGSFEEEIKKIQSEIDAARAKSAELEESNENIRNEIEIFDPNGGKLQKELNEALKTAKALKSQKKSSDDELSVLLLNDQNQNEIIEKLKKSLMEKNQLNDQLTQRNNALDAEIESMKNRKREIENNISEMKKSFNERINKIVSMG